MKKTERIRKELAQVRGGATLLKPEDVISWAKQHRSSALHASFEWDDSKAANEHRLVQARHLITLYITHETKLPVYVSLSIDRVRPGGGYRQVADVVKIQDLYQVFLHDALAELTRIREKYSNVKELANIYAAIDKANKRLTVRRKRAA